LAVSFLLLPRNFPIVCAKPRKRVRAAQKKKCLSQGPAPRNVFGLWLAQRFVLVIFDGFVFQA
jgi:hypothetical protein